MMWRLLLLVALGGGVLGDFNVTEEEWVHVNNIITDVCKKNNAEDRKPEVQAAFFTFMDCLADHFDREDIKASMSRIMNGTNSDYANFFTKYCTKSSQLKACINAAMTGVTPCLPNQYRTRIPKAINTTDQIIDLVCYKDGERIASFIENGYECIEEKSDALQSCSKEVMERLNVSSIQETMTHFTQDKCKKLEEFSTCVVIAVQGCKNQAAADMAEALFAFVKDGSCPKIEKETSPRSAANFK